jgi:hypothetical protein
MSSASYHRVAIFTKLVCLIDKVYFKPSCHSRHTLKLCCHFRKVGFYTLSYSQSSVVTHNTNQTLYSQRQEYRIINFLLCFAGFAADQTVMGYTEGLPRKENELRPCISVFVARISKCGREGDTRTKFVFISR